MAYKSIEDYIEDFLVASIERTMEYFDFDGAFDEAIEPIRRKLAEHGLLTVEDFVEADRDSVEGCYGSVEKLLEPFTVSTPYIVISAEDILDGILMYRYKRFHDEFSSYGSFKELLSIYERIQTQSTLSTTEKVLLFDEVIHAQHETGDIFDVDIPSIKAEIDARY